MVLKSISHDSEKFSNDFLPPPCLPLKLFFPQSACNSLVFTCNCAKAAIVLPAHQPSAPSSLSTSTLGPKEPAEACFLTSCHLFQSKQFHFCSLYVKIRPDLCIIDTIVIHWSISEHHERVDLIC